MTEQEKELGIYIAECVNGLPDSGDNFKDCFTLAKAIIARYPQITKKPVKISFESEDEFNYFIKLHEGEYPISQKEATEYLDSHYVEVVL